jgi:large subunit ribosomal protein L9
MKVILTDDVKNLGRAGETIKVAEGYARNFLLPKKMAVVATPENVKRTEQELNSKKGQVKRLKRDAEYQAEAISAKPVILTMAAGEGGKLFGAVTTADIENKLKERGIEIDKRKIEMPEPIKMLGTYTVSIKIHSEVAAELKIVVQAENAPVAEPVKPAAETKTETPVSE